MELEYRDFYGEYYEDLLFAQTEVMDFLMGKCLREANLLNIAIVG